MILGPTYKFQSAREAIERVKAQTKKRVITFNDIIPPTSKELLEKREYMQSEAFLNDPFNKKMFEWGEKLAAVKHKIIKKYVL